MSEVKSTNRYAGTKTEKNLMEAFAGESMARNKYTYFASVAKKAGYEQIAALFLHTADNEKEHAKLWFKALGGVGTTEENLLHAAETCMSAWPVKPMRKASMTSLNSSAAWAPLKRCMKSATASSWPMSRPWKSSRSPA